MSNDDVDFEFFGVLHHETAAAILVSENGDEKSAVWLPKSQISYGTDSHSNITITMPGWLADAKGFT